MAIATHTKTRSTRTAASRTACRSCGEPVQADWRFCESCAAPLGAAAGADAVTAETDGVSPWAPQAVSIASDVHGTGERWWASAWVRVALVAVILALVIGAAFTMTIRSQDDLDKTKAQLTSTQQLLKTAQDNLAATAKQRDETKAQLDAKSAELTAKVADLAGTKSQLDTFKTCLNGIKRAFDYADAGDAAAADRTLRSVQGACDTVDRLL